MLYKVALTLVSALVVFMLYKNNTTPSYLGLHDSKLAPMPSTPNAVSSQTDDSEKYVDPLSFESTEDAKKKVKRVLAQLSSNVVLTETDNYLHVIFTTDTMRYKDDVELYFDQDQNLIHYRSQSRVGYSDKGLNRARYNKFAKLYNELN
ncbi:DUF1499 domain-containing protein [Vibrio sp. TH_r3]|uniref:DUF1499 domain-containing protein n=1 Tax=Vibrio sp. TH_r3 TaxID=3082084 RepID=UPI00295484B0|nr:DUF1499 domain-containing protein [Vibrio sp. TH_r3]MDV7103503.1 DUF1499 domain-containing protein [Vibrio sp. TH_r3]